MAAGHTRVGIERKILTSILWVGILPMVVALIAGYIAGRGYTSTAVQQTLLTAAQKTADGLDLIIERELSRMDNLSRHAALRAALIPDASGNVPIESEPQLGSRLSEDLFHLYAQAETDGPNAIALYGVEGDRLVTTSEGTLPPRLPEDWKGAFVSPQFRAFSYNPPTDTFSATMVTDIDSDAGIVGYLVVEIGINSLMEYAMGASSDSTDGSQNRYQVAYINSPEVGLIASRDPITGLSVAPIDDQILALFQSRPLSDAQLVERYADGSDSPAQNVMLAFQQLRSAGLEAADIYLVVYRPMSEVYYGINTASLGVLLVCALAIAFLCINAYRDVHNNIVRPVSLLNEGAQIIRQGDFDLKLKIDTGDEIAELATSFNEMAVALKKNMRQLEESEENYRSLVTSMRDGVYQTNAQGVITFLNPAGVDILGYSSGDEAVGSDMDALFEDDGGFGSLMQLLGSSEESERARIWMRHQENRRICVEMSCNRTYDNNGTHTGYEGILRDVTRSVRLEEEARERAERISAINQIANVINSSLEAGRLYESLVVELKKLVAFDYASVALLSEMGTGFDGRQIWPDEELAPGHTFTLDSDASYAAWVAREQKCLLVSDFRGGPYSHFAEQFPPEIRSCLCVPLYATGRIIGTLNLGSKRPGAFSAHNVETLEQMAPHLAVAIRNAQMLVNLQLSLEEVTRGREKLHAANEELKTLDEMKTNLLSNVSHELRTPLVSVMGYTDMILNGKAGPTTNTQQEYLEISLRNVEKLVTLIENLLDFSRLHRGDERLVFDTFDLVDCAKASVQIIKPVADSRNIRIAMDVPDTGVLVEGDKAKMGQVFNNLLSNAVKFNDEGGLVTITMQKTGRSVDVSVKDTGIGIPEEALDKVFTRFYQYDGSSTRKYGGTGIGLSIAQDIVRLHGSSITVSSERKKGSTFRFELSLSGADKELGLESGTPVSSSGEPHVLVQLCSMDRPLTAQIRNILFSEGFDMIHSTSPEAALTMVRRHHPDCIVVDYNGGDSSVMLDELLQDSFASTLPVILLTNEEEVFEKYRRIVASRIKRSFRKSSFLSGLHHALSRTVDVSEPAGHKILCVDDDREIQTFISRCLEAEGYECTCCSSGEKALEILGEDDYGLVLLDIAMPGLDGWQTCRAIRNTSGLEGVKVYMVSAKPIDHNLDRIKESGADGFLLKPFRPEDLIQLVQGLELQAVTK